MLLDFYKFVCLVDGGLAVMQLLHHQRARVILGLLGNRPAGNMSELSFCRDGRRGPGPGRWVGDTPTEQQIK